MKTLDKKTLKNINGGRNVAENIGYAIGKGADGVKSFVRGVAEALK
ncbi:hypothetical protein DOS74_09220 [Staphylococcus felis]|uniref:Bacteriocin n=1 Tax=Staphylococcus felis TaxID=46127 RepID=A0AAX1RUP6_9STAP|nr:bacteriocin [Staphylococcus felis]REH75617.1 hypothetical protein DOS59_09910 [Staphylococcus felis]REH81265.1 hypothetical protein DOS56_10725 [Staphylococcus felis]REH84319.1 hypothetical protein DOS63_07065 [Staphylococcus felis]REI14354.1 hypothetical protein DOS74_09220 [Staphylococcus felis]REI19081.1 hypothetical protein DOS75_01930 [Staphylococcus felis]